MESISMNGSAMGVAGAMSGLKGSLSTQKNAVGQLLEGAQQTTAEIAKSGTEAARTNQMHQMGVGQKLDITA